MVLSDVDYETVCDGERVISGANFMASPLSNFLELTDLAGQHFLLHPVCSDLFVCLQHLHAHRKDSTSAVVVLPKHVWRKSLRNAQYLQDLPCSDVLFVPTTDKALGECPAHVYYATPGPTESVCAVDGASGLTMQVHGTVSNAAVVLSMDSMCSHTLLSAAYVRRMKIAVEPRLGSALQVAVAIGIVCTSQAACKVRLKLQDSTADLTCHGIPLAEAYQVMPGDDWLSKYSATLTWGHQCCVLTKGNQYHVSAWP